MAKKLDLDEATRQIAARMLATPPKRHEEMKIGNAKTKRAKSPAKRKAVEKAGTR